MAEQAQEMVRPCEIGLSLSPAFLPDWRTETD